MMTHLRHGKYKKIKYNIIKYVRNLFRLKREIHDAAIKNTRNLLRLEKENEAIKDRGIKDIGTFLSMKKKIIPNQ